MLVNIWNQYFWRTDRPKRQFKFKIFWDHSWCFLLHLWIYRGHSGKFHYLDYILLLIIIIIISIMFPGKTKNVVANNNVGNHFNNIFCFENVFASRFSKKSRKINRTIERAKHKRALWSKQRYLYYYLYNVWVIVSTELTLYKSIDNKKYFFHFSIEFSTFVGPFFVQKNFGKRIASSSSCTISDTIPATVSTSEPRSMSEQLSKSTIQNWTFSIK